MNCLQASLILLSRSGQKTDFDICKFLTVIDANIYNYVINESEKLCAKFKKRIDEATALRDWRPAKKFVEPQELSNMFFSAIKTEYSQNVLKITIPGFFNESDLVLSIHCVNEVYYVQDNGCAINRLKKRVDEDKLSRILNKVCSKHWLKNGCVIGFFTGFHYFFYYLQKLIFIANGDLVYSRFEEQAYKAHIKERDYIDEDKAQSFDYVKLLSDLKNDFSFGYDENCGLYFSIATTYSLFSTHISFLIETIDDNICISDMRKGKTEGEIFEAFYWSNDDITPYEKFINKFTKRFNAEFKNENVYLTDKKENWIKAQFKFINLAVLLSEIGHNIKLPK